MNTYLKLYRTTRFRSGTK